MTTGILAILALLAPLAHAGAALERPPDQSKLLILLVGEAEFDFDFVTVDGPMEDPVTPSVIGIDGMRQAACEDLVAGMEHWTAFDEIECVDWYQLSEIKAALSTSHAEDVPEEIRWADYLLLVQDFEIRLRGFLLGQGIESYREQLRISCAHVFWDKHAHEAVHSGDAHHSRFGKPPNFLQRLAGKQWVRLDWRDGMDPIARGITKGSPFREKQKVEVDDRYRGLD